MDEMRTWGILQAFSCWALKSPRDSRNVHFMVCLISEFLPWPLPGPLPGGDGQSVAAGKLPVAGAGHHARPSHPEQGQPASTQPPPAAVPPDLAGDQPSDRKPSSSGLRPLPGSRLGAHNTRQVRLQACVLKTSLLSP